MTVHLKPNNDALTYKIKGWSHVGLGVFFNTEVLNFCGGSSNHRTHRGFMLPVKIMSSKVSTSMNAEACRCEQKLKGDRRFQKSQNINVQSSF